MEIDPFRIRLGKLVEIYSRQEKTQLTLIQAERRFCAAWTNFGAPGPAAWNDKLFHDWIAVLQCL